MGETPAIFVVYVEHEDPQIWPSHNDLLKEQRDRARFADPGRDENREMLAQHLINVEARGDCRVLLEVSDLNRARATIMENQPQLARPYENRCVADRRVGGHSALEVRRRRLVVADFADQFELRHCDITCARRRLVGPQAHVGDEPGQQRFSGAYAEKLADSRAHLLGSLAAAPTSKPTLACEPRMEIT